MTSPRKSRDPKTLRPADAADPRRLAAIAIRRDLRSAVSHPGLSLRHDGDRGGAFKGEDPGFVYSRFSDPTVAMFERRMALLEGAEAARATASGMAAVTAA